MKERLKTFCFVVGLSAMIMNFLGCDFPETAFDEETDAFVSSITGTWKLESVDGIDPVSIYGYKHDTFSNADLEKADYYCIVNREEDNFVYNSNTNKTYNTRRSFLKLKGVFSKYSDNDFRLDDEVYNFQYDLCYNLESFSWSDSYKDKNIFSSSEIDDSVAAQVSYEDGITLENHSYILNMWYDSYDLKCTFCGLDLNSEGNLVVTVYSNFSKDSSYPYDFTVNPTGKINHKTVLTYKKFSGEIPVYKVPVTPPPSTGNGNNDDNTGNSGNDSGSSEAVDVIGTWKFGDEGSFSFNADGTYTYSGRAATMPGGTYSVNGSVLTMNFTNGVDVTESFDVTISGNSMTLKSKNEVTSIVFSGYFKQVTLELTLTK